MTKPHEVSTFRFVTSSAQLLGAVCHAPERGPDQRLDDDSLAHLRVAVLPFDEGDRHLDHPKAGLQRPPGEIDLEAVARRGDIVQSEPEQRLAAKGAEAAGCVPQRDAEHHPGPEVSAAGQHLTRLRPVDDLATFDPARSENKISVGERRQQLRQLLWLM